MDSEEKYIVAEGPAGLETVLTMLLEKSQSDPVFAKQEHYVLYQLGSQKSLIKVQTDPLPFKFWYYDLMGRPATVAVKDTIAQFLWEKCGEKEHCLQEAHWEKKDE